MPLDAPRRGQPGDESLESSEVAFEGKESSSTDQSLISSSSSSFFDSSENVTLSAGLQALDLHEAPPLLIATRIGSHTASHKGEDGLRVRRLVIGGDAVLCAVLADGHGGHEAALFVVDHLIEFLGEESHNDASAHGLSQASERAFARLHALLLADDRHTAGTTATLCLLNETRGEITTAHVGDSAALLVSANRANTYEHAHEHAAIPDAATPLATSPLTSEHCLVDSVDERRRVSALGAKLGHLHGRLRAFPGGVHCARAIGDRDCRAFVSPVPDIKVTPVPEGSAFVLIASDGVWSALRREKVVKLALTAHDENQAAEQIVTKAMRANGRRDVTCVFIFVRRVAAREASSAGRLASRSCSRDIALLRPFPKDSSAAEIRHTATAKAPNSEYAALLATAAAQPLSEDVIRAAAAAEGLGLEAARVVEAKEAVWERQRAAVRAATAEGLGLVQNTWRRDPSDWPPDRPQVPLPPPSMPPRWTLPDELVQNVAFHLCRLSGKVGRTLMLSTCRSWHAAISAVDDELWKLLSCQRYPFLPDVLHSWPSDEPCSSFQDWRELYRAQMHSHAVASAKALPLSLGSSFRITVEVWSPFVRLCAERAEDAERLGTCALEVRYIWAGDVRSAILEPVELQKLDTALQSVPCCGDGDGARGAQLLANQTRGVAQAQAPFSSTYEQAASMIRVLCTRDSGATIVLYTAPADLDEARRLPVRSELVIRAGLSATYSEHFALGLQFGCVSADAVAPLRIRFFAGHNQGRWLAEERCVLTYLEHFAPWKEAGLCSYQDACVHVSTVAELHSMFGGVWNYSRSWRHHCGTAVVPKARSSSFVISVELRDISQHLAGAPSLEVGSSQDASPGKPLCGDVPEISTREVPGGLSLSPAQARWVGILTRSVEDEPPQIRLWEGVAPDWIHFTDDGANVVTVYVTRGDGCTIRIFEQRLELFEDDRAEGIDDVRKVLSAASTLPTCPLLSTWLGIVDSRLDNCSFSETFDMHVLLTHDGLVELSWGHCHEHVQGADASDSNTIYLDLFAPWPDR
jgi:serine/threonine protein phosphatase PrpC